MQTFMLKITTLVALGAISLTNCEDYPEALRRIDKYRNTNPKNGEAYLSQSERLNSVAEILAQKGFKDWKEDPSGPMMVLKQDITAPASPSEESVLGIAIDNFAVLAGRNNRFENEVLDKKLTIGRIEYNTKEKRIAKGSQGVLFFAKTAVGGRNVVVKQAISPEHEVSLEKEVKNLQLIGKHQGVVNMLNDGEVNETKGYAVVFELLLADLFDMMQLCGKQFSLKTSILITKQLISAVQHIHARGFVHRDIKVENIMVVIVKGKYIVKLVDFGLSENYKGQQPNEPKVVGTITTMSPDAHYGKPPQPVQDLWSIMLTFNLFVFGSLMYDRECTRISKLFTEQENLNTQIVKIEAQILSLNTTIAELTNENLVDQDKEIETKKAKIVELRKAVKEKKTQINEKDAEMKPLMVKLVKLKYKQLEEMVAVYPELTRIKEILENNDMLLDYGIIQECFDNLMQTRGIVDDRVMDWEERLTLLLQPSTILHVGIGVAFDKYSWTTVFILQHFFAPLMQEFKTDGKQVKLFSELEINKIASPNIFKAVVPRSRIENLSLNDFIRDDIIAMHTRLILTNGVVYVSFAKNYDVTQKKYSISLIIRSIVEILYNSFEMTNINCMETAQQDTKAAIGLRKLKDTGELQIPLVYYEVVTYAHTFQTPNCFTNALRHAFQGFLANTGIVATSDLAEIGYSWCRSPLDDFMVVFAFKFTFNFVETFEAICADKKRTLLSLSVDETLYDSTISTSMPNRKIATSFKSKPTSSKSLAKGKQPLQANAENRSVYARENTVRARTAREAVRSVLTEIINDLPNEGFWNFRVQWMRLPGQTEYNVMVIQDEFCSMAAKIYQGNDSSIFDLQKYQHNFELKDGEQGKRQWANNHAFDETWADNKLLNYDRKDGTFIFAYKTSCSEAESVDDRIFKNVETLNKLESNANLQTINPHDVASVIYGYAITSDGSVKGISIFETHCFEAFELINNTRSLLNQEIKPLQLHENNYTIGASYREKYKEKHRTHGILCGGSSQTGLPKAGTISNKGTPKEALTSYVQNFLKNTASSEYLKVTDGGKKKISFVVFQPKAGKDWKIYIDVY